MNSQVTDTQAIDFNQGGWYFRDTLSLPTFTSAPSYTTSRSGQSASPGSKRRIYREAKYKAVEQNSSGEWMSLIAFNTARP